MQLKALQVFQEVEKSFSGIEEIFIYLFCKLALKKHRYLNLLTYYAEKFSNLNIVSHISNCTNRESSTSMTLTFGYIARKRY